MTDAAEGFRGQGAKGRFTELMLFIVLLLLVGHQRGLLWPSPMGFGGGASIGFGTILVVLLIAYIARMFR
jgi:hypothetical protein